jgi:hypothetical protein
MSVEGFWTVHFEAAGNRGAGVVVLMKGKIFGGDSGATYIGTYSESGDTMTGTVQVQTFEPSVPNVMGLSNYTLNLRGTVSGDVVAGQAGRDSCFSVATTFRVVDCRS